MTKDILKYKRNLNPRIYAFLDTNPQYDGLLRVGQTDRTVEERMKEHYPTARPGKLPYKILLDESRMRADGSIFRDTDIFKYLKKNRVQRPGGDWFRCDIKKIQSAILAVKTQNEDIGLRSLSFKMRPEQEDAVNQTYQYFSKSENRKKNKTTRFLWNAKMRFGKTFAAYKLAQKMKWKRVLILTYIPAVKTAWQEDIENHIDFKDWQFISRDKSYKDIDKKKPFIYFGSIQDFTGKTKIGDIKEKNKWAHEINWDCIILDEYHYGAWRDRPKDVYDQDLDVGGDDEHEYLINSMPKKFDLDTMPLTSNYILCLSGTPFRAIESGEFIEEQIYSWTYIDEQKAKMEWKGKGNPYLSLPKMIMLTYKLPSNIADIANKGEFNEFDLNEFFKANGIDDKAKFVHEDEVQKWLELIRGAFKDTIYEDLREGASKPPMPFSDKRIKSSLNHTVWFLPSVSSCFAMKNLLESRDNTFYRDYGVIVAAGIKAGLGDKALPPVLKKMEPSPIDTKTITLTCRKLLTGVSVKPWTGIFMLGNTSSAQTYFQSAFRVQTPWTITNELNINEQEILKDDCYVFDFAPNRTLRLVSEYCKLDIESNTTIEKKLDEFLKFLPILRYDGFQMNEVDAGEVLEIADTGTSSTLLAKKWRHDSLINVDNLTLERILNDPSAIEVLMKIEGFRNIKDDIQTIVNKTSEIKNLKTKNIKTKDQSIQKQLTDAEKEYRSKKQMIKDKLKQFITRIPIFMYLTDYREETLEDVITKLDTDLFKKVTGLAIKDFDLLVKKGVFNRSKLNMAIIEFKNYEDPSLIYLGIKTHKFLRYGGFDTVIKRTEAKNIFVNQI